MSNGYDEDIALAVVEAIASGRTLVDISSDAGMPTRQTIYRWLSLQPKFFDAYERAKELSAQSFEDEALEMARDLKGQNDFTGTKVQAYNIAMGQLRWSASRRDKTRYGQQIQTATAVPIQITTTLNLGQPGQGPATSEETSIYHVEGQVLLGPTPDEYDAGQEELTLKGLTSSGEMIDLQAEPGDDAEPVPALPKPKPGPKRKPGHKSAADTKRSVAAYSKGKT